MQLRAASANDYRWDDLRVSLISGKLGTSRNPGFLQLKDNGAGSQGVFCYHFDSGAEEELYWSAQMPHDWALGTSISPHLHWCPINGNSGNVNWGIEYTIAKITGSFGNTTIDSGSYAAHESAYLHQLAAFSDIDMTGMGISTVIVGRIFRNADAETDTYASDAAALFLDFHYRRDDRGSHQEYFKGPA